MGNEHETDAGLSAGGKTGARPRRSSRARQRPLVERLHEPSPPPHRTGPTHPGSGTPDARPDPVGAVEYLAARGLTAVEIAAHLGLHGADSAVGSAALAAAFERGRLEGIVAIKRARFDNALEGGSTAQKDMLALLGAAAPAPAEEGITVVRSVIGGGP